MGLGSVSGTRVRRRFSRWCGLPVLLTLLVAGLTATARADTPTSRPTSGQGSAAGPGSVPSPSVRGPIPWSYGIQKQPETDSLFDLTPFGYSEKEYFVSGTAAYHANPGSLDSAPGATTPAPTAPYTIRMIVRAPKDPGRFNGTVAVEWNNVTAQFDETPVWDWTYPTVLRAGTAFVIVSVQQAGYCCSPLSLKVHDPVRYGSMNQPGDGYAFSIYSQVLQSLRHPVGLDPMGGLHVNRLLAAGESQSADELYDYITSIDYGRLVDGFLLVGGGTTTYPKATPPRVPVINVFDQWTAPSTPPNISANYRVWEVAGSSHVDMWVDRQEFDDPHGQVVPGAGQRSPAWRAQEEQLAGNYGASYDVRENSCVPGGNLFPDRYVMDNALVWLDRWVRTGEQPPTVPMLKFGNVTTSTPLGSPPGWDPAGTESTDQYGNALGGYRLPPITVPVASYVPVTCLFFGETIPFSPAVLRSLYPTHADYVRDMQIATDNALKAGLILPWDASDLMARAKASKIPDLSLTSPLPPSASLP